MNEVDNSVETHTGLTANPIKLRIRKHKSEKSYKSYKPHDPDMSINTAIGYQDISGLVGAVSIRSSPTIV